MNQIFVCLLNSENNDFEFIVFPSGLGEDSQSWPGCCMNGKQFYTVLHSRPPSLHTSFSSLSSTSPLLPLLEQQLVVGRLEEARWGWAQEGWGGLGGGSGKRRMQLAVYLWRSTECSCVNVVVRAMLGMSAAALPGPDQRSPQLYLRKWQSGAHWPILRRSVSLSAPLKAPLPSL